MDADRNLLFGVLALQADLIEPRQFIEACLLWTSRKDVSMADLLVERGWIVPADREHVEYLLRRKLNKHGGLQASLAAIPDDIKRSLADLADDDIQHSLAGLARADSADATVAHVPAPPERYARLRLHATGGIGRVWLAHDSALGRDVALKELRPERAAHAAFSTRFLQEARITGQLEHPGVVPVYELAWSADREPFYTMRFVKGRTMTEAAAAFHRKRSAGRVDALDLPTLLNAFVTVCHTVAYAHSRGVIHRDLKGQNVILGDFGEVVVLDWGLAKRLGRPEGDVAGPPTSQATAEDSAQTVQGQTLGTPAYMAPEQAAGRLDLIDHRSDVYGLGAVLYEILTGNPPFGGPDTAAILRNVQEKEPVPPRQLWPEVPAALEALCLRALAKRPADRPAAAADLAKEVQGWQEAERQKAVEALRASEARYRALADAIPQIVWTATLDGRLDYVNERASEYAGGAREANYGTGWQRFVHPDDLPRCLAQWASALQTGEGHEIEFRLRRHDGAYRWHLGRAVPVRGADGRVVKWFGTNTDIEDQKRAEEELRNSRERFELAVLGSQDGLWDWDLEANHVWYSPQLRAMFGYDEQEFPNLTGESEKRIHPDDHARWRTALDGHVEGLTDRFHLEYRFRHKDGSYRWVRGRGVALRRADGRAYRMAGSSEDITDRKLAEEELRKSRERFELAVQGSQDGLWDWDLTTDEVYYSPRYKTMLGYEEHEFPNRSEEWAKRVHPEDLPRVQGELRTHFKSRESLSWVEFRMRHKDGSYRWIRSRAFVLRDAAGRVYRMAGSHEDITDRKTAEEELAHERHLLRCLMDTIPDKIYFKDRDGHYLVVNKALAEKLGLSGPGQAIGKTVHDYFAPEYAEEADADEREVMRTGQPLLAKEVRETWPDGRVTWVSSTKVPWRGPDGEIIGTFGVSRDIAGKPRGVS